MYLYIYTHLLEICAPSRRLQLRSASLSYQSSMLGGYAAEDALLWAAQFTAQRSGQDWPARLLCKAAKSIALRSKGIWSRPPGQPVADWDAVPGSCQQQANCITTPFIVNASSQLTAHKTLVCTLRHPAQPKWLTSFLGLHIAGLCCAWSCC